MGHDIRITETDQTGLNSGRSCYRVECGECQVVIHEATTAPHLRVKEHLEGGSPYEQPLRVPGAKPGSPFAKALWKFPVGTKVEVQCDRLEWDSPADKVVAGHVRFRDSDDDPLVCVCLVSTVGTVAGWFSPENLRVVKGG